MYNFRKEGNGMNNNEHIYRELMEIEEEYRRLQRRAEYLVGELSRTRQRTIR